MNTLDAIRARRAAKHYDPEFTIPDDQIAELKDLIGALFLSKTLTYEKKFAPWVGIKRR